MTNKVKELINDFPDFLEIVASMRNDEQMSYLKIANFFRDKGYQCSKSMLQRVLSKYDIKTNRRRVGKNNSFYGKSHSDATKESISKMRKESGCAKGKNNPMYGKSGEQSPAWKGGISNRQSVFYASTDWSNKRFEIMDRDSFTCMQCGNKSNTHGGLNVHHIIPMSVEWDKRLDNTNLITLCVSCHKDTFSRENEMIDIFQNIIKTKTGDK